MPVSQDATSGWYVPASSAEWTELLAGTGLSAPSFLWLCQESSGNIADSIGGVTLTANGGGVFYQQSISGWSRKAFGYSDTAGTQCYSVSASLPDLNTTSMTALVFLAVTNTPGAQRSTFNLGPGATKNNNISCEYTSSNFHVVADGTTSGTGSTNHGAGVVRCLARFNRTATTSDLFVHSTGGGREDFEDLPTPGREQHGLLARLVVRINADDQVPLRLRLVRRRC